MCRSGGKLSKPVIAISSPEAKNFVVEASIFVFPINAGSANEVPLTVTVPDEAIFVPNTAVGALLSYLNENEFEAVRSLALGSDFFAFIVILIVKPLSLPGFVVVFNGMRIL